MAVSELISITNTADHYPDYKTAKNDMKKDTQLYGGFAVLMLCSALMYYKGVVTGLLLITRPQIDTISSELNSILTGARKLNGEICLRIAKAIRVMLCSFLRTDIPSLMTYIGQNLLKISQELLHASNQGIPEMATAHEKFQAGLSCFAKRIVQAILDDHPDLFAYDTEIFFENVRGKILEVCAYRNPRTTTVHPQQQYKVTQEVLQDVVLWVRKELAEWGAKTIKGQEEIPDGCVDVTTVSVGALQAPDRNVRQRLG